jgi:FMN phosphatase YigB (HAD superfamily)
MNANLLDDCESQLDVLRKLDRELFNQLGVFEYDFRLLSAAAVNFYHQSLTPGEAARIAIDQENSTCGGKLSRVIEEAYRIYDEELKRVPPLYPDTVEVLSLLRESRSNGADVSVLIFSDGLPARLERILQSHQIRERNLCDEVILCTKSKDSFEETKRIGLQMLTHHHSESETLFVMTGDSLKRDIKFGNQTGYVTVYKPANFLGQERPSEEDETPDYTIDNLRGILPVLKDLGVTLTS